MVQANDRMDSEEGIPKFTAKWSGQAFKARNSVTHYPSVNRIGKGKGDSVVFTIGDIIQTDVEVYTAQIVDLYETISGERKALLRWLYGFADFDEVTKGKLLESTRKEDVVLKGEMFWSDHMDENNISVLATAHKLSPMQEIDIYRGAGGVIVRRFYSAQEDPTIRWLRHKELRTLKANPTRERMFNHKSKKMIPNPTKRFFPGLGRTSGKRPSKVKSEHRTSIQKPASRSGRVEKRNGYDRRSRTPNLAVTESDEDSMFLPESSPVESKNDMDSKSKARRASTRLQGVRNSGGTRKKVEVPRSAITNLEVVLKLSLFPLSPEVREEIISMLPDIATKVAKKISH
eukprot:Plantae.Rhodophyta-Hildenbrandia_rubra.ctg4873.p1 GENE.Plantae.Rhodophyta-Hildenbrandia_rubra.ctg4873~~Plantae.Rhodophyta-Hildenbrandia_rubra.ctg4873.p1  ORF type:complete len:345 (+),score=41.95 Plantae.Rhodophyta-Hildenbrandia_rubra.ctg4873:37-1071(+)